MRVEATLRCALMFLTNRLAALLPVLLLAAPLIPSAVADSDILYVCDVTNNLVRRFNAQTGASIPGGSPAGVFVLPGSNGLDGPRGIFRLRDRLVVASQNVSQTGVPGQILRYRLFGGRPDGVFVPSGPDSPFTPDGIVYWRGVVYASDFAISDSPPENPPPGRLLAFDARSGTLLRQFSPPTDFAYNFHPRGLVIGANGLLYVSNFPDLINRTGGQVLVFDPATLDFLGAFISDPGGVGQLNRPDGIVFGPDGILYVTSFRADPTDSDSIRIYDGHSGVFIDKIDLYTPPLSPTNPRAFAQALLFGPGGKLFVPISGGDPSTTGRIRRYDVTTKAFDVFADVPTSPELWYLTFGKTNPGTLAYDDDDRRGGPGD